MMKLIGHQSAGKFVDQRIYGYTKQLGSAPTRGWISVRKTIRADMEEIHPIITDEQK